MDDLENTAYIDNAIYCLGVISPDLICCKV